jgi:hypothetical protein
MARAGCRAPWMSVARPDRRVRSPATMPDLAVAAALAAAQALRRGPAPADCMECASAKRPGESAVHDRAAVVALLRPGSFYRAGLCRVAKSRMSAANSPARSGDMGPEWPVFGQTASSALGSVR